MSEASATVLRESFDRGFAEAPPAGRAGSVELLVIQAGSGRLALRVADLAGIYAERAITRLPSPWAELLGLAAFRGALVPVYDLGALQGGPPATNRLRWVALVRGVPPVALAFETLHQHTRVTADVVANGGASTAEVVQLEGGAVPLLDTAALLARLRERHAQEASR